MKEGTEQTNEGTEGRKQRNEESKEGRKDKMVSIPVKIPSLKLTYPLKKAFPNRKVVFQPSIFRGHVSFREGIILDFLFFGSKDVAFQGSSLVS